MHPLNCGWWELLDDLTILINSGLRSEHELSVGFDAKVLNENLIGLSSNALIIEDFLLWENYESFQSVNLIIIKFLNS